MNELFGICSKPTAKHSSSPFIRLNLGLLIPITWFFIFQPYLSPLPSSNDLQPVSLVLAGINLLLGIVVERRLHKRFILILFFAVGIEAVHIALFQKPAVVYVATYIFLAFIWKYAANVNAGMVRGIMAFHLIGILWQTFDAASFNAMFEHFLRELKHTGHSGRGSTGFSPEPTFASALSTVYALIYFRFFSKTQTRNSNLLFFLMYSSSIWLTASSLGYLFSPLVLVTWFLRDTKQTFVEYFRLCFIASVFFVLAGAFLESFQVTQRGLVFAKRLLQNPEVVLLDSSLQERVRSLYVGYKSTLYQPFGFGHGNFPRATAFVNDTTDLRALFNASREIEGSASGAGSVLAGTGVIGLLFYCLVMLRLCGRGNLADLGLWIVSLAMFTFSFSPAFPLIYVLLVMRQQHAHIYRR